MIIKLNDKHQITTLLKNCFKKKTEKENRKKKKNILKCGFVSQHHMSTVGVRVSEMCTVKGVACSDCETNRELACNCEVARIKYWHCTFLKTTDRVHLCFSDQL